MHSVIISAQGASILFETDSHEYLKAMQDEFGGHASAGSTAKIGGRISVILQDPVEEAVPECAIRLSTVFPSSAVYAHKGLTYMAETGSFFITINPAVPEISIRVSPSARIFEKVRFLTKRLLVKAVEDSGLFWMHGSAVCDGNGDGALLFTGVSGSGKTTSLLTMLERGYRMVTDDVIILREKEVLPFYLRSMIHTKTVERFPSLRKAFSSVGAGEYSAQSDGIWLSLGQLYSAEEKPVAPRALFNTHVWNSERSECRPATDMKTVPKLIRNYMLESGSIFEPHQDQARRVFSAYSSLASSIPCFDLYVGRSTPGLYEAIMGALK